MAHPERPQDVGRHLLGPHVVGQRVVVRRVLRGQRGPSGGPALTDVLGTCLAWSDGTCVVQPEEGEPVRIAVADIVSGKPVPPRPSVRLRLSAEEADRRAAPGWRAEEEEPLGAWTLRASGGFSNRANSVLALGDPGLPAEEALARTVAFYRDRDLVPRAHVVDGSREAALFEAAGWETHESTRLMLGSVPRVLRALPRGGPEPVLASRVSEGWLATDDRARRYGAHARAVLEAGEVALATLGDPVVARGRAAYHDEWVGVAGLWTAEASRRQGLGRAVLRALLEWGAERGAGTTYLQVVSGNADAIAFYESVGLVAHHTYRYVVLR